MAYKAVFVNESHIAHAGLGYKEDWQGKWHGSDGTYQVKPEWMKAANVRQAREDYGGVGGIRFGRNTSHDKTDDSYNRDRDMGSGNTSTDSGSTNSTSERVWPDAETIKNAKYYEGQDPGKMTDEKLREYRNRKAMEDYYNKNNPSRSEEFMKGAQQANQLVSQGAAFTKSLMPDKIYTAPLDLSNMTDEQLRAANNRAQLEMQYNQYFNPPKQNEAKKWVDVAATGIGLAISAAGVAVPIVIEVMKNRKKGG